MTVICTATDLERAVFNKWPHPYVATTFIRAVISRAAEAGIVIAGREDNVSYFRSDAKDMNELVEAIFAHDAAVREHSYG